jgi:sporulation protein YqfC
MRKSVSKRKKERVLDRILEVPREISTNEPKVTIAGFNQMLIENYKAILEYQDIYIRIKTYTGIININGMNLHLGEMTSDDIMITGDIETVDFEKIE